MRIGFIGLGTMGSRMVRRLIEAEHETFVYDRVTEARDRMAEIGAIVVDSVPQLVERADVVFTSLPMPSDVEAVYLGPDGAIQSARSGQVFVDLSTIDPSTARRVAAGLADRGVRFIDAPVSGGPTGAERGTLVVMAGGDAEALELVRPLLAAFSGRVVHVGPVGAGSILKLANQLLVGANTIAAMEAVTFAAKAGIAPSLALDVLSAGAGDSFMLRRSIREFVLTRDFSPQFAMRLLVKDLRLYESEAAAQGTPSPSGQPALALFEQGLAAGLGSEDYAAILKLIWQEEDIDGDL